MADYTSKTGGCITFKERTHESNYVHFQSTDSGCWSYVGMSGGKQSLNYQNPGCTRFGTVQHEMLHALGFHHEQSSTERDEYVAIHLDNVSAGEGQDEEH